MAVNIKKIRSDFKLLTESKKAPIYFDNACTTLRPTTVVEANQAYYLQYPACHNRAVHRLGKTATENYDQARKICQKFINARSNKEIIFLRNTTEGLNLVAQGLKFKKDDVVLTTTLEHNSNTIPWMRLHHYRGLKHEKIQLEPNFTLNLEKYKLQVNSLKPKLVSVFMNSHVTGIRLPIQEMCQIAHEAGALFLLDAAQAVLTHKLDVQKLDIDFMAFSFHKAFGPSGLGLFYGKEQLLNTLEPLCVGGETVSDVDAVSFTYSELPYKLEAGLQNYSGAIMAGQALNYIEGIGQENIQKHVISLNQHLQNGLHKIKGLEIIGPHEAQLRGSIFNFYFKNKDMGEISILLDSSQQIMTRSGFHCAHSWYHQQNLPPSLRASFTVYNTIDEVELFIETLSQIQNFF